MHSQEFERGTGATTYLTRKETTQFWTLQDIDEISGGEKLNLWGLYLNGNSVDLMLGTDALCLLVSAETLFERAYAEYGPHCDKENLIIFHAIDQKTWVFEYQILEIDPKEKKLYESPRFSIPCLNN